MRFKRWPVRLGVVLACAMTAVLFLAACAGSNRGDAFVSSRATPRIAPSPSPHPLSSERQATIASALSATQPSSAAALMPRPVASAYLANPFPMLLAGPKLQIDWRKLRNVGPACGSPGDSERAAARIVDPAAHMAKRSMGCLRHAEKPCHERRSADPGGHALEETR